MPQHIEHGKWLNRLQRQAHFIECMRCRLSVLKLKVEVFFMNIRIISERELFKRKGLDLSQVPTIYQMEPNLKVFGRLPEVPE